MALDTLHMHDLKHINGMPVNCRICGAWGLVQFTIGAHQWGWMVEGECGHVFPVRLTGDPAPHEASLERMMSDGR